MWRAAMGSRGTMRLAAGIRIRPRMFCYRVVRWKPNFNAIAELQQSTDANSARKENVAEIVEAGQADTPLVKGRKKRKASIGKKEIETSDKGGDQSVDHDDVDMSRANELGPKGQPWPPLGKDVLMNMARFPSCILLTRVGGFYESYFDQAPILAGLLRIKLTTRTWGGRPVAMAGFPIFQLEKYLKKLVIDQRRLVAICDEFKEITLEDGTKRVTGGGVAAARENPFAPSTSKALSSREKIEIRRRVTRVVSPGTLIDEYFLDPFASNWVMSIVQDGGKYGMAWLDVSTADFNTTICNDEQEMRDEVARVGPTEVVLEPGQFTKEGLTSSTLAESGGEQVEYVIKEGALWEALDPGKVHISFCARQPLTQSDVGPANDSTVEDYAVANLTAHLRSRLLDFDINNVEDLTGALDGPTRRRRDAAMTIDASTLSALEINTAQRRDEATFNALSNTLSIKGSLLSYVRRTTTKGGARMLAQWLTAPSTSLPLIHRRQALVALFKVHTFMTEDLRIMLRRRAGDISRALQRILTSRNDEQDLLEVRDFARLGTDIVKLLKREVDVRQRSAMHDENGDGWTALVEVVDAFQDLSELGERLGEAIDENVIDKRLREQEDRIRELEMVVMGEAGKGEEEGAGKGRRKKQVTAEAYDHTGLWGQPFEHLIRPSTSQELSALTKEHVALRKRAFRLESDLRTRFGEKISLRFLLGQGHVIHVGEIRDSKAATLLEMEKEMQMAYKSKSTRTYYHEQFTKIGGRLNRVERELQEKETIELQRLRLDVLTHLGQLRKNAMITHELDILAGFAVLATEMNLVRPVVNDGDELIIEKGRHIGVEMSLLQQQQQQQQQWLAAQSDSVGTTSSAAVTPTPTPTSEAARPFTPNDVHMNAQSRLHLITGPNMGGKSTLLRMVAIVAILAQVGSFVPAARCTVGVIDQIFSRIGAHDAIHADRSTFMVEMLEVAQFLRRSTKRSLVLCDEVGRGTDSATGTSLAYATALRLKESIRCKCLFATHLHVIGDLLGQSDGVEYFCTDLEETDRGEILFSHKLRPGLNRNSHGLTIARLAGMPDEVLSQARETLTALRGGTGEIV